MKLLLLKNVEGINRLTGETRLHGKIGDVLFVLLESTNYYICDSLYYPNIDVIVFKNQVEKLIKDDLSDIEKQISSNEFIISGDNYSGDIDEIIPEEIVDIGY